MIPHNLTILCVLIAYILGQTMPQTSNILSKRHLDVTTSECYQCVSGSGTYDEWCKDYSYDQGYCCDQYSWPEGRCGGTGDSQTVCTNVQVQDLGGYNGEPTDELYPGSSKFTFCPQDYYACGNQEFYPSRENYSVYFSSFDLYEATVCWWAFHSFSNEFNMLNITFLESDDSGMTLDVFKVDHNSDENTNHYSSTHSPLTQISTLSVSNLTSVPFPTSSTIYIVTSAPPSNSGDNISVLAETYHDGSGVPKTSSDSKSSSNLALILVILVTILLVVLAGVVGYTVFRRYKHSHMTMNNIHNAELQEMPRVQDEFKGAQMSKVNAKSVYLPKIHECDQDSLAKSKSADGTPATQAKGYVSCCNESNEDPQSQNDESPIDGAVQGQLYSLGIPINDGNHVVNSTPDKDKPHNP